MLDSKNKKRLTEISFQICVSLGLFPSFRRWAICLYLECEVKVFLTFAPYSFPTFSQVLFSIGFYQEKSIRNKPNKLEIFLLGML